MILRIAKLTTKPYTTVVATPRSWMSSEPLAPLISDFLAGEHAREQRADVSIHAASPALILPAPITFRARLTPIESV